MTEDSEMSSPYKGEGVRGWGWALFGVATAIGAKYVLGDGNGLFGGGQCNKVSYRDLEYERQLTEKDAKIGKLEAQQYADASSLAVERRLTDKIEKIETQLNSTTTAQAVYNAKQFAFAEQLAGQVAAFDRMTARYFTAPVMAASEAALATFTAKGATPTAANAGTGSGTGQ